MALRMRREVEEPRCSEITHMLCDGTFKDGLQTLFMNK